MVVKNHVTRGLVLFEEEIWWASLQRKGKGFQNTIYKLSLVASIYFICKEREMNISTEGWDSNSVCRAALEGFRTS